MGRQSNKRLSVIAAAVIGCAMAAMPAKSAAGERTASLDFSSGSERGSYISVGATTRAPIGWAEFCIEYKPECDTKPSPARDVVLSPKAWADMLKVNAWVNETIKPETDLDHWGVVERWNYPDDGKGDC